MKAKKNTKQESDQDDIMLLCVVSLLRYADKVNECISNQDFVDLSELYKRLSDSNNEDDALHIVGLWLSEYYMQIEHFQRRELYESCEMLNKAMNKELNWTVKYVLAEYDDEFVGRLTTINRELKDYYLGDLPPRR